MSAYEKVDKSKVAVPVQFRQPPGEVDRLRSMMASLVVELRNKDDVESFEESLDFELEDDDFDLSSGVSQSEHRLMQEERLLTEAEEASRVLLQRREAANLERKLRGSGTGAERGKASAASDGGGAGVRGAGSVDVVQESEAKGGRRHAVSEDERTVRSGDAGGKRASD